jgi:CDGSH-type Zn-finger protein
MGATRDDAVTITAYQDGPYLVRGEFRMLDQDGNEIDLRRPTVALCRCGKSRIRPLCDGTHKSIKFRAPSSGESLPIDGSTHDGGARRPRID